MTKNQANAEKNLDVPRAELRPTPKVSADRYVVDPSTALGVRLAPEERLFGQLGPHGYQYPKRTAKPAANCPFCGREDVGDLCSDKDSKAIFYWIQCSRCEACGPTDYDAEKAIALWDKRRTQTDDE